MLLPSKINTSVELTKQIINCIDKSNRILSDDELIEILFKDYNKKNFWKKWGEQNGVDCSIENKCVIFNTCYFIVMRDVQDDINSIYENISFAESKFNSDMKAKYQYFLHINRRALSEINEFINSPYLKDLISDKILNYLLGKPQERSPFQRIYHYNYTKLFYNPSYDSSIIAVFSCETEADYLQISGKKQNNLSEYDSKIEMRLKDYNVPSKILDKIENNFVLRNRKNVFNEIIEFFNQKNWELVINLLSLQLEGLFYDFKRFSKVDEQIKSTGSLSTKAEEALRHNEYLKLKYYPYVIDFETTRNEIAHIGIIELENPERSAKELLFACYNVLTIFDGLYLPFNNVKTIFKNIAKDLEHMSYTNAFSNNCIIFAKYLQLCDDLSFYAIIKEHDKYKGQLEFVTIENGKICMNYRLSA